jgi:transcriptional regulator with XRE-family HTH domain
VPVFQPEIFLKGAPIVAKSNENLKAVMEHFGLTNLVLAKALELDPSLVSRYLSGQRQLKAASPQIEALADFILTRSKRVKDIEWFKERFQAEGLPTDSTTVYRFKQNLIMWLSSDGEKLRKNLGTSLPGDIAGREPPVSPCRDHPTEALGNAVKLGCLQIVMELASILKALPRGTTVNIFLSSDQIVTTVNEDVATLLLRSTGESDLKIRMVVCVSGDTKAMSALIDTYMAALITGHIQLSVVHGMTQTVTNQMHLIIPDMAALLVTETPGAAALPVAVAVHEPSFITEIQKSFEQAARYAQPVLNIYGDDFSRNILEIIYQEFCTPGALDVVKDNVNPMYLTEEAYNRVLRTHGHSEPEYAWRSAEFTRFKSGMDETLRSGSLFREILSLSRLNQIVRDGFCRMPGLYFMKKGFVQLDAQGCAAILNGYIRYLEVFPNFHLLILDDIALLHSDNCWQLKQNHHLAINYWSGPEPVMIHSDQIMLLREFQAHFDRLWAQGAGGIGSRANVISILRDVAERLHV